MGQTVRGTVQEPGDVDVYKISVKAGQTVTAEVDAARHGSSLDSLLVLYDEKGRELASNDDMEGSKDSLLTFTIPADGTYYLCLSDALGMGSEFHGYLLGVHQSPLGSR